MTDMVTAFADAPSYNTVVSQPGQQSLYPPLPSADNSGIVAKPLFLNAFGGDPLRKLVLSVESQGKVFFLINRVLYFFICRNLYYDETIWSLNYYCFLVTMFIPVA